MGAVRTQVRIAPRFDAQHTLLRATYFLLSIRQAMRR